MGGREETHPSRSGIWEGWNATVIRDVSVGRNGRAMKGPHNPTEFAERLYEHEALNPTTSSLRPDAGAKPYTLQWFLNLENQRHRR